MSISNAIGQVGNKVSARDHLSPNYLVITPHCRATVYWPISRSLIPHTYLPTYLPTYLLSYLCHYGLRPKPLIGLNLNLSNTTFIIYIWIPTHFLNPVIDLICTFPLSTFLISYSEQVDIPSHGIFS